MWFLGQQLAYIILRNSQNKLEIHAYALSDHICLAMDMDYEHNEFEE